MLADSEHGAIESIARRSIKPEDSPELCIVFHMLTKSECKLRLPRSAHSKKYDYSSAGRAAIWEEFFQPSKQFLSLDVIENVKGRDVIVSRVLVGDKFATHCRFWFMVSGKK